MILVKQVEDSRALLVRRSKYSKKLEILQNNWRISKKLEIFEKNSNFLEILQFWQFSNILNTVSNF